MKKGQIWYMDFILAVMIFAVALTIYYTNVPNIEKNELIETKELGYDAELLTGYILSEGYPTYWNESSVKIIGILNNDRTINKSKIRLLNNMSRDNYSQGVKKRLNIPSDYGIVFKAINKSYVEVYNVSYIGHSKYNLTASGINFSDDEIKNIIKVDRIVMYDEKPITIEVYMWKN